MSISLCVLSQFCRNVCDRWTHVTFAQDRSYTVGSARVSVDATLLTTHDPARNISLLVNSLARRLSSAFCKLVRSLLPYSARRVVRLACGVGYSNSWWSEEGSGRSAKSKTRPNGVAEINRDLSIC